MEHYLIQIFGHLKKIFSAANTENRRRATKNEKRPRLYAAAALLVSSYTQVGLHGRLYRRLANHIRIVPDDRLQLLT